MKLLTDANERRRVLTELDETFVVEAAAGTGKTALMAARLTMLLLRGTPPESIAAITFTELAASELAARVHLYVNDLLAGRVPKPFASVLSNGLDPQQRATLSRAADGLGQLTTATIHAFCQKIITSYAVEADIDPGARVLDADQANAAFDAVFERWLKRRLSRVDRVEDPLAVLSRVDPQNVVATLNALAKYRLEHRGGRPAPSDLRDRMDVELCAAVADFRHWLGAQPGNPSASALLANLETLAQHFEGKAHASVEFGTLWQLAHPPQFKIMRRGSKELQFQSLRGPWIKVLGKQRAEELDNEARARFELVSSRYSALLGSVSTAIVERLSGELDEVLAEYGDYKRLAAVFDFADLLEKARELLSGDEAVRAVVGTRYRHIFVDEFQDTDPIQCEILFLIAAEARTPRWQDCQLRAGSLFLVGDPKQAIYGFRGAHVECYRQACGAIQKRWPQNVVQITANFRSRPPILEHVNRCFSGPLSGSGQPGYVALSATLEDRDENVPTVSTITVDVPERSKSIEIREAEAEQVADACSRLIGNVYIEDEDGATRLLRPGDIALLAPTGTDLWVYERALEEKGLRIASQAGKSIFRRQEIQDLLALTRTLADPADGVAFGAFMRGPLVGLTEEELLDIAEAIPRVSSEGREESGRFTVLTRVDDIAHTLARGVVSILQDLRRRSRATTPALLIAEAVERLQIRPIMVVREGTRSARALANIEAFIELARPYAVRGLRRFVRDVTLEWRNQESRVEGRIDGDGDAVEIITMHSAKGLEWPVVIPINTATWLRRRPTFVHRLTDNTIHWIVGDVVPPGLLSALVSDEESQARERERLWYVACTRARELLILPRIGAADAKSWARVVQVAPPDLLELDLTTLKAIPHAVQADAPNEQDQGAFQVDQARIAAGAASLSWIRPSLHDGDRLDETESADVAVGGVPEQLAPIGAGRVRGLILHKLLEEALSGELTEELGAFSKRASVLLQQLDAAVDQGASPPSPAEMGQTALRTLALPEVSALRPRILPELPVFGVLGQSPMMALAGRVDALALTEAGQVDAVLDWKSDVSPSDEDMRLHAAQLRDYMQAVDAQRGALVYMTSGSVRWVQR